MTVKSSDRQEISGVFPLEFAKTVQLLRNAVRRRPVGMLMQQAIAVPEKELPEAAEDTKKSSRRRRRKKRRSSNVKTS